MQSERALGDRAPRKRVSASGPQAVAPPGCRSRPRAPPSQPDRPAAGLPCWRASERCHGSGGAERYIVAHSAHHVPHLPGEGNVRRRARLRSGIGSEGARRSRGRARGGAGTRRAARRRRRRRTGVLPGRREAASWVGAAGSAPGGVGSSVRVSEEDDSGLGIAGRLSRRLCHVQRPRSRRPRQPASADLRGGLVRHESRRYFTPLAQPRLACSEVHESTFPRNLTEGSFVPSTTRRVMVLGLQC